MISRQRSVVTLLSITVLLLVCHRAMSYFKTQNVIEHSTKAITIRVNPLSIKDSASIKDTKISHIPSSSPAKNDLTGQSMELNQAHSLQIKMYRDRAFLHEQYSFDSSEKVFLVMEFNQLVAGEHNIFILWKDPNGQSVNTSTHNISMTHHPLKHRAYFWLKLIKNGMFTEMITGDEYKGEVHGRWGAEIYFDGDRIATQHFMVFN